MLTKGDEYPLHQTPEPIAYSGTDRNFYDRYFFNGYAPDGSEFFAVAFGVYPHVNVADAHFSVVRDGVQHCLHASRILGMERMDLEVGPIAIDIVEPLKQLRVRIASGHGLSAELLFEGRAFPIEEPRFTHRIGPRTFMDYTRMTQNGRYSGWIEVDGVRRAIASGTLGTRDRSWGVRPIGTPDPQPYAPPMSPGFFWLWSPLNFPTQSVFYHRNADAEGHAWNTRGAIAADAAGAADIVEVTQADMALELQPGLRHARRATLTMQPAARAALRIEFEPIARFQMRGIGYFHPRWRHGELKGELLVEREDFALDGLDLLAPENLHIQAISRVRLEDADGHTEQGLGVLEQLIAGPYRPLGFGAMADPFQKQAD